MSRRERPVGQARDRRVRAAGHCQRQDDERGEVFRRLQRADRVTSIAKQSVMTASSSSAAGVRGLRPRVVRRRRRFHASWGVDHSPAAALQQRQAGVGAMGVSGGGTLAFAGGREQRATAGLAPQPATVRPRSGARPRWDGHDVLHYPISVSPSVSPRVPGTSVTADGRGRGERGEGEAAGANPGRPGSRTRGVPAPVSGVASTVRASVSHSAGSRDTASVRCPGRQGRCPQGTSTRPG